MSKVVFSGASADSEEIHSISYLRGLAALGVVFYHVRMDLWVGFNYLKDNPGIAGSFAKWVSWLSIPSVFMGSGVMLFSSLADFASITPMPARRANRSSFRNMRSEDSAGFIRLTWLPFSLRLPSNMPVIAMGFSAVWIGATLNFQRSFCKIPLEASLNVIRLCGQFRSKSNFISFFR